MRRRVQQIGTALASVVLALLIVATLLACWMPAYVGATPNARDGLRWRWPRREGPNDVRAAPRPVNR